MTKGAGIQMIYSEEYSQEKKKNSSMRNRELKLWITHYVIDFELSRGPQDLDNNPRRTQTARTTRLPERPGVYRRGELSHFQQILPKIKQ